MCVRTCVCTHMCVYEHGECFDLNVNYSLQTLVFESRRKASKTQAGLQLYGCLLLESGATVCCHLVREKEMVFGESLRCVTRRADSCAYDTGFVSAKLSAKEPEINWLAFTLQADKHCLCLHYTFAHPTLWSMELACWIRIDFSPIFLKHCRIWQGGFHTSIMSAFQNKVLGSWVTTILRQELVLKAVL